ncbi:hypothetical protein [Cryobacterium sp. PH31-O1]|uniref:hypothetical protein n=1 Tax=Cryobacterium sp. PH31-O1 TaxID=3046306 RepID=UPI0024BB54A1|nr:hypothetical protein [Cryobacterium sp. PH31-O1]MDJ0337299.1 hypothetical protein [Cryobacterium sp. PH31-O1]
MRVLAFILSIVVSTALLMAGVVLLVVETKETDSVWIFIASLAMVVFVYGPLTLGSFRAYWDVTGSKESRRYYRRIVLVVLALEVLAAIVTVIFAILTVAGPLIPVAFIGGGVILTVTAIFLGPAIYRYDRAHPRAVSAWVAIEKAAITKRIMATTITFLGVLVLGLIGTAIVNGVATNVLSVPQMLLFALSFAFISSGAVCVFSTLGWSRRLVDVTDRDPSRLRRVVRVVLRNKPADLDGRDLVAAARYAAVISVTLSFQLAYIVLLYAGLFLQQINVLRTGIADTFSIAIIVFLVVILAVLLPIQIVRIRRARRYSRDHSVDLNEPVGASAN